MTDRRTGGGAPGSERRGDAGENPFESLYGRARSSLLDVPTAEESVETPDGRTHLLTAGDPSAPPVLVLQGGNVTCPVTLAWVQALAEDYRLVAPDTPGEPGLWRTDPPGEYGRWVESVLDGLGLGRVAAVGVSHGAGVLLEAATRVPDRVAAAGLVVPAGFGVRPSLGLARVVLPSLLYRVLPRDRVLAAALGSLFTSPFADVEPVVRETVATALRTADVETGFPGPDGPAALSRFRAPTVVVAADRDPLFPAAWVHDRASQFLPRDPGHVTLRGERHFLSPAGRERVVDRVGTLLDDAGWSR